MGGGVTHSELESLLGAYALDAVDPEEAAMVDQHLAECARCRAEVETYRETASALAHVGAPAPPQVWSRIASQLEEPPPRLQLARVSANRWRPSTVLGAMTAMAAAAALVVGVLGLRLNDQGDQIQRLEQAVAGRSFDAEVAAAAASGDARRVHLVSTGEAAADVVLLPDGRAYLVQHTLPPLSPEQTYQLWGQLDDRTVSLGVLGPTPERVRFTASAADLEALAITAEPAGGVVSSDKSPVAAGAVPRTD